MKIARRNLLPGLLTIILLFGLSANVEAQETGIVEKSRKNIVGFYVGLFDFNINYERAISQRTKSSSKLRFGTGYAMFPSAGEGYYVNPAFVQLFGSGNSHVEINGGIKYMLTNSIEDPDLSDQLLPDLFLGYRFEKPTGGLIFRVGLNYPTIISVGLGYKW